MANINKDDVILNFRHVERDDFKGTEIRAIHKITKQVTTITVHDRCQVIGVEDIGVAGVDFHTVRWSDLDTAFAELSVMMSENTEVDHG